MREGVVYIELTDAQREKLRPLRAQLLTAAYDEQKPCLVIGQPDSSFVEVGFAVLTHEETLGVLAVVAPEIIEQVNAGKSIMDFVVV